LCHIVFHDLACTFCLSTVKRQPELVHTLPGKVTSTCTRPLLKRSKERPGNPSAAVVRPKLMILDDNHARIGRLDSHLAGGNEDTEVGDRSLGPIQKPFGNRALILGFD